MTHNQVSYWNARMQNRIQQESNRIAKQNADTNKWMAEREEYWTHRQHNFEDSKFGWDIFKWAAGGIASLALFG